MITTNRIHMKVLLINPLDERYGSTYRARATMQLIWRNHPESKYLEGLSGKLRQHSGESRRIFPATNSPLSYAGRLPKLVAELRCDLLWIQKFLPMTAPLMIWAAWHGVPMIVDWDDLDSGLQKNWLRKLLVGGCERWLPKLASLITTHSQTMIGTMPPVLRAKTRLLPQTVQPQLVKGAVTPVVPRDRIVFAHLCTLNQGGAADFELILQAAMTLIGECPNVFFLIVGGGEFETRVRQRIAALGLSSQFHFTGLVDPKEVGGLLMQAHFGLVCLRDNPANRARVSLKTLEYLALGLPVIGRLVGESARLFEAKLAYSCRDEDDLLNGMRLAVQQKIKVVDYSGEIRQNYSLDQNLPIVQAAIKEALNHARSKRP